MTVAVVAVVRDEPVERIERLLASLRSQDVDQPFDVVVAVYPRSRARELATSILPGGSVGSVRFVVNPSGGRSAGLNLAVRSTDADMVCRLDARSLPPVDYVRRCVSRLVSSREVALVGGAQRPVAIADSPKAKGIARALRNPWLLGAAPYRRPGREGPVDTVYLGAFRRTDVLAAGGYDERLLANEDFDLAQRLSRRGVVWLERDLVVDYESRTNLRDLFGQYLAFGEAKVAYWTLRRAAPNARQTAALGISGLAALSLAASMCRPRRMVLLVLGGVGALAAVDHVADPHETAVTVRGYAIVASVAVMAGWLGGIVRGVAHAIRAERP